MLTVSAFDVNLFAAKVLGLLTWPKVPGSEACRVSGLGQVAFPMWSRRIHWGLCQNLQVTMVTRVWKWDIHGYTPNGSFTRGRSWWSWTTRFSATTFSDKPICFEGTLIHDDWKLKNRTELLPFAFDFDTLPPYDFGLSWLPVLGEQQTLNSQHFRKIQLVALG